MIAAQILDSAGESGPVTLTVRRDGETIATLEADVGRRIEVKAPIEHAGVNVIELEIAPTPGELTAEGDRAVVNIDGVRDKLRVLLVSGKPHPGERMWRNLLKSDANVDLVHFTILRPPEKGGDGVPINELSLIAFPVRTCSAGRSRISISSSSTATRSRRSCRTRISKTSSTTCATAGRS